MDKRIYTALMLFAASLQVACGDSKKDKMAAFMAQCQQQQACIDMYKNAANNTQIAGLAATSGLPQTAAVGTTPVAGQVPSTTVLPASVSDAQVKAAAAKISSQLTTLNTAQGNAAASAAPTSSTSNYSPASAVEIGVTRLTSNEILPSSAPMRSVSSLQPSSAQAPVAQQDESESGVAAGH